MSDRGTRHVDEPLALDDFQDHVGTQFNVQLDAGESLELELAEAKPIGTCDAQRAPAGKRQPFSLMFLGPSEPVLPQRIYPVQHAGLGELQIFLVPIGPDADGKQMRYEAVFN